LFEFLPGELAKILGVGGILKFTIFDAVASRLTPARDPQPAESAIAVEQHDGFADTICDSTDRPHIPR
jgi:hypothetical protein